MISRTDPQEYIFSHFGTIKNCFYRLEVFEVYQLKKILKMN